MDYHKERLRPLVLMKNIIGLSKKHRENLTPNREHSRVHRPRTAGTWLILLKEAIVNAWRHQSRMERKEKESKKPGVKCFERKYSRNCITRTATMLYVYILCMLIAATNNIMHTVTCLLDVEVGPSLLQRMTCRHISGTKYLNLQQQSHLVQCQRTPNLLIGLILHLKIGNRNTTSLFIVVDKLAISVPFDTRFIDVQNLSILPE